MDPVEMDLTEALGPPDALGATNGVGIPGLPDPEAVVPIDLNPPVIDLTSGDSNVGIMDRVKGGTFFPTDSRQNEIFLQNQGYQTRRGPNGELLTSINGSPFQPVQQDIRSHPFSETATRLASGGGELMKMTAMGIGAAGGLAMGGPVAPGLAALGAGAGYAAGGRVMAEAGSGLLGVPEETGAEALSYGAGDLATGYLGQLAGPAISQGVGKIAGALPDPVVITNFLRDKLNKTQAFEKLISIFKIDPKIVGQGVIEAAEAGARAPVPYHLSLENPVHETLDHLTPLFHAAIPRAATTGENELISLGKVVGEQTELAGKLVGDSIAKLDATPAGSAISLTQLKQVSQTALDAIKLQNRNVSSSGANIGNMGERIDNHLGGAVDKFIQNEVTKAMNESQQLGAQLVQLQRRLPTNPGLAQPIQMIQADILRANAQIADPKVPLSDWWRFYGELQDAGEKSFLRQNNTPDLVDAYGRFGTAISQEVDNLALQIDPQIGQELIAAKKDYSLFKDGQKLIKQAVGEASTQKGPVTGLAIQPGQTLRNVAAGIPRTIRHPATALNRGISNAVATAEPILTPSQEFAQVARILPTSAETQAGAMYRGKRFEEMAQAVMSKPLINKLTGTAIASRAVNLFIPPDATAEADLSPLRDGMMMSVLIDNGLAPPESRQTGFDKNQVPPEVMQQVNQSVMQAIQPLNDAIKFGNEDEIGAAYSQVVKQFPELFPPPKTGIKGEVVDSRGKVKLYDPADRARYASRIQADSKMPWNEKAKVISELNSTFTVLNPKK